MTTLDATSLLVVTTGRALFRVDIATGNRMMVSGPGTGVGPSLGIANGVVVSADGATAWVSSGDNGLTEVDMATGNRTLLLAPTPSAGPTASEMNGLARLSATELVIIDELRGTLLAYTIATGAVRFLSESNIGNGMPMRTVNPCLGHLDANRLFVGSHESLVGISLTTGDRAPVSDPSTGTGPVFHPQHCAFDAAGYRVLAIDSSGTTLYAIDPATGNRSVGLGLEHRHRTGFLRRTCHRPRTQRLERARGR